jgi:hypothetical protein
MPPVPGDERCKHGEIAAWCGESECMAARTGLPVRVWRTPFGSAYHRTPTCQALLEGHRMAERYGHEAHPAESVPLSEAMSALLGECFHCFPENVPLDAKPCQVLSGGVWVDGIPAGMAARWDPDAEGYAGTVLLICVAGAVKTQRRPRSGQSAGRRAVFCLRRSGKLAWRCPPPLDVSGA